LIYRIVGNKNIWENSEIVYGSKKGDKATIEESPNFRKLFSTEDFISEFSKEDIIFIDTETTGLRWDLNDSIFSIAMSAKFNCVYYINFQDYSSFQRDLQHTFEDDWFFTNQARLAPIFKKDKTWIGHNLKFDYHMLKKSGFELNGNLEDTMIRERILSNDLFKYSLAETTKRHFPTLRKDDAVENYIEKNGLFNIEKNISQKPFKNKYYNMVPFHIIAPYASNDVFITREIYNRQTSLLGEIKKDQKKILELESNILKICCGIEDFGIKIDVGFCNRALEEEEKTIKNIQTWFKKEYGFTFIDSVKTLGPLYSKSGIALPLTEKNNESISGDFLEKDASELSKNILYHRSSTKRISTYLYPFLIYSKEGILRTNMRQSGTRTGRFSYMEPNLQNLPSNEQTMPIRRSLVPRENFIFVSLDYAQQEFRMMLDYAGEMELIEKINNGLDPHQATAELTGLSRKAAKVLNFGLLYGMGIQTLANQLGVTYNEAKLFKEKYFRALPKVKELIYSASNTAKNRGYIFSWLGRKFDFSDPKFSYKAINALIQGGCADVTKTAMVLIDSFIKDKKLETKMLLQIHDELLFEIPENELQYITDFQKIMTQAYPSKHISLTTSVSYSLKSFGDMIEAGDSEEIAKTIGKRFSERSESVSFVPA